MMLNVFRMDFERNALSIEVDAAGEFPVRYRVNQFGDADFYFSSGLKANGRKNEVLIEDDATKRYLKISLLTGYDALVTSLREHAISKPFFEEQVALAEQVHVGRSSWRLATDGQHLRSLIERTTLIALPVMFAPIVKFTLAVPPHVLASLCHYRSQIQSLFLLPYPSQEEGGCAAPPHSASEMVARA